LSNDTPSNVTSISLTAGDWDVFGAAAFVGSGLTATYIVCAIGTVSNSISSNGYPQQGFTSAMPNNNSDSNVPVNPVRISIASTTTVYLVAQAGFSAGSCYSYGFIRARRIR
jgi:hypothetical protein